MQGLLITIGDALREEEESHAGVVVPLRRDVGFSFDNEHETMNE